MSSFFKSILRFYYLATGFIPRDLPTNEIEYELLKYILVEYFDVPNTPATMAQIAGQIQGTPINSLKKSWSKIANAAKRVDINALAEKHKRQAFKDNNDQIEAKLKQAEIKLARDLERQNAGDSPLSKGPFDLSLPVPALSDAQGSVVPLS